MTSTFEDSKIVTELVVATAANYQELKDYLGIIDERMKLENRDSMTIHEIKNVEQRCSYLLNDKVSQIQEDGEILEICPSGSDLDIVLLLKEPFSNKISNQRTATPQKILTGMENYEREVLSIVNRFKYDS